MARSRILVVEDEVIVAMGIRQKLEDLGYEVTDIVLSGEDAVEKALETQPDLILMDIVLKGKMDGIEAASKIRNQMDIPIIYLTAYSDEETLERARVTEPYGYIIKPFKESEINANIEMALYKHDVEKKKKEELKNQVLADFYEFIMSSMPLESGSEDDMKLFLFKIFSERLESELRPDFEQRLETEIDHANIRNVLDIFKTYLTTVAEIFASFGIQSKSRTMGEEKSLELLNCPWREEAMKKPLFCLNCQAILNKTLEWSGMEGEVERKSTIASGGDSCYFYFHIPELE